MDCRKKSRRSIKYRLSQRQCEHLTRRNRDHHLPRHRWWRSSFVYPKEKTAAGAHRSRVEGINTEFLESSATITQDDKMIYFTSNRPGGYGGTDIYSCELGKGGRWVNIKNLGPLINTELDEEGVFISANGQHLYFSSNGLAGMGDLDIYRSTYDANTKEWGEPVNLGYPINSVENDIYFVLTADEKFAYISSLRRENLGEQDIYKVDMTRWKPVYLDQPEFSEIFAQGVAAKGNADPVVTERSDSKLEEVKEPGTVVSQKVTVPVAYYRPQKSLCNSYRRE